VDGARRGLTSAQAAARLRSDGPNALPAPHRRSPLATFAAQLVHAFALLLWVAAGLAALAGLPQLTVAIAVVVLVNAAFSFLQEARADRAAERLRSLLPGSVSVRRDGQPRQVEAADVVAGDVLLLEAGDRVPADGDVLLADAALLDTSTLTGESEPTTLDVAERVYAGTFLVEGLAEAVVGATGPRTRLAGIASATSAAGLHPTPLTRELTRVVRGIGAIAVVAGGAFLLLTLLIGRPLPDAFVLAIGVTVALVPEALLPTVTLALAWGAERMAKRQVLVRSLEAVETLGSTTFVCTDKTGTLTLNQMTVVAGWTPAGSARVGTAGYAPTAPVDVDPGAREAMVELGRAAARCSRGYVEQAGERWVAHGDPMEAALDAFARRLGVDTPTVRVESWADVAFAFDPHRRRMSVVAGARVLTKGAPDALLPLCPADEAAGAAAALARLSGQGLRVLAVASRPTGTTAPTTTAAAETGLHLLGLVGLEDPPRPESAAAIAACRSAGVQVAMITGDHPVTAAAIALEVGLRTPDGPVHLGADLPADDEALGALLDHDGVVVARVAPEDKLRIARALRARGHVVAMTGDGVNDGPALREADIGVAMGASGTDVAREAADLVLLDDRFSSVVAGIELGRATYANVRRFLTYHLTDNVAELAPFVLWGVTGGAFPLALGVLQVLALDIGTDTLSATALGAEPPARGVLAEPPAAGRLLDRTVLRRAFGLLGPVEALVSLTAFTVSLLAAGWRFGDPAPGGAALATASGATFLAVVLGQAANAFACRSEGRAAPGRAKNLLLAPAVAIGIAFCLVTIYVPALARQLGQAPPSPVGWAVALGAPVAVLVADALDKAVHARRRPPVGRASSAMTTEVTPAARG